MPPRAGKRIQRNIVKLRASTAPNIEKSWPPQQLRDGEPIQKNIVRRCAGTAPKTKKNWPSSVASAVLQKRLSSRRRMNEMLHLQTPCLALAVVAPSAVAARPLDSAVLLADVPGSLAGAPHG